MAAPGSLGGSSNPWAALFCREQPKFWGWEQIRLTRPCVMKRVKPLLRLMMVFMEKLHGVFPANALPDIRELAVTAGVIHGQPVVCCGGEMSSGACNGLISFLVRIGAFCLLSLRRQLPGPGRNQLRFGHQSQPVQPLVLQQSLLPLLPRTPLLVPAAPSARGTPGPAPPGPASFSTGSVPHLASATCPTGWC